MKKSTQLQDDIKEVLDNLKEKGEIGSSYLESLYRALDNSIKHRWPVKEVFKLWEEVESLK